MQEARCDADNGYWTFMEEMYSAIFAQEGEPGDFYENCEPDIEGISWKIEISELLRRPDKFQELIVFMESDDWFDAF